LGGTPYETKTKTVKQVDFDKLAEIKNKMAMGYQQAALLDPRYSAVGEKAIDEIDKGILTRTFAAGMSGDTDTVSKGLKALTGQEFSVSLDGDYFEIKGVGDSAPMKVKRSEIHLLADPINFAKAAQKYAEMQQKQQTAQMRYDAMKQSSDAKHWSSFPFLVMAPGGMIPAINEKDAQAIAESYGVGYVPNKDYEKKVAQIQAIKQTSSLKGQKYIGVDGKPLSEKQIADINQLRSEDPTMTEDELATLLAGQGIQIVGYKPQKPGYETKRVKSIDPKTGEEIITTTRIPTTSKK
jgi:hypothetical protein